MKRTLVVVAVLVGFAAAANAVTLTVVSDKTTYSPGETITLSVSGTDAGWPSSGASAAGIFGRLQFSGVGSISSVVTQTQKQVGNAGTPWTLGVLTTNGSTNADSFNQVLGTTPGQPAGLPAKNPFASTTMIAGLVGTVNVDWNINTGSGFELNFFGLTAAPGTSFTIVPEPTTFALIGLGLMGLALGGRRRA